MIQSDFEMSIDDYSFDSEFENFQNSYEELLWKFHLRARAYAVGESNYLKFEPKNFDFQQITPHSCNVNLLNIDGNDYTTIDVTPSLPPAGIKVGRLCCA